MLTLIRWRRKIVSFGQGQASLIECEYRMGKLTRGRGPYTPLQLSRTLPKTILDLQIVLLAGR